VVREPNGICITHYFLLFAMFANPPEHIVCGAALQSRRARLVGGAHQRPEALARMSKSTLPYAIMGLAPQGHLGSPRFRFGNPAYANWSYRSDTRQWYLLSFVNPEDWVAFGELGTRSVLCDEAVSS
jgi:hypothetical protein